MPTPLTPAWQKELAIMRGPGYRCPHLATLAAGLPYPLFIRASTCLTHSLICITPYTTLPIKISEATMQRIMDAAKQDVPSLRKPKILVTKPESFCTCFAPGKSPFETLTPCPLDPYTTY